MTSTEILLGSVSKIIDCEHKTAPENKKEIYAYSVGTRALSSNTIDLDACKPIDEETYRTWSKRAEIEIGDIILAREAPVGGVGLVKFLDPKLCLGQRTVLIKPTRSMINSTYLSYLLQSKSIQNWFSEMSTGSTVLHLNVGDIKKLPLGNLPSLETQKTIAEILHSFDQKIELNDSISRTLEEIARTIFESWFIDFDPVKAKMAGEKPAGMDAVTAALFPDSMVDSEIGLIPKGWSIASIGDVSNINGGKMLSREEFNPEGMFPIFGGAGVMGKTNKSNADGFVITVGRVGAYCGQFFYHRGSAWVNNNASRIIPKDDISGEWMYLFLKSFDIENIKKGAAQPFVSNSDLANSKLMLPSVEVIHKFTEIVEPIFKLSETAKNQAQLLSKLRDSLLPRLISGELQIPEEMLAS